MIGASKKLLQATAGNAGGAGLDITEVFSTYLYDGTEPTDQTITNNIDLAGEGGMVWIKGRSSASSHLVFDTERGTGKTLLTNTASANQTYNPSSQDLMSFNSDGFTVGDEWTGPANRNGLSHASWTFRKAPKFFDVVTFTGDGVNGRVLNHNLGVEPGMVVFKRTSSGTVAQGSWFTYHRESGFGGGLALNSTDSVGYTFASPITAASDTTVTINNPANNGNINAAGETYVAYLFAHNDGDGEFGPDGDQDIIKCGSLNSGTVGNDTTVDLGFEPQWILFKNSSNTAGVDGWWMYDTMRGWTGSLGDPNNKYLQAQTNAAEGNITNYINVTPTGFVMEGGAFDSNHTYIYMAIRRGPLAQPESATEVFGSLAYTGNGASTREFTVGSAVSDMMLQMCRSSSTYNYPNVSSRLTDKGLTTTSTAAEFALATDFDRMDGVHATAFENTLNQSGETYIMHSWKRAPNYFDVVAYSGNGSTQNVSHNLGVAPEMMWIKTRNAAGNEWKVYHSAIGNNKELVLNSTAASGTASSFNNTTPTSSVFSVSGGATNDGAYNFIAYLFASLDGVSKVGSYTGDGTTDGSKVINCGFSSGSRFVLIKCASAVHDWYVFDTQRGIVAGNDPTLQLNTSSAEITGSDLIDPDSSGFIVGTSFTSMLTFNQSNETYIFYAIA